MKTERGFERLEFIDSYGEECSIQESSNVDPYIWLGVNQPRCIILCSDAIKQRLNITSETTGWCEVPQPENSHIFGRMHLNRKQAKILAKQLNYFAKHGVMKSSNKEYLWEDEDVYEEN